MAIQVTVDSRSELYFIEAIISSGMLNGRAEVKRLEDMGMPKHKGKIIINYHKSDNYVKDFEFNEDLPKKSYSNTELALKMKEFCNSDMNKKENNNG